MYERGLSGAANVSRLGDQYVQWIVLLCPAPIHVICSSNELVHDSFQNRHEANALTLPDL
jgi:hypothetical protein